MGLFHCVVYDCFDVGHSTLLRMNDSTTVSYGRAMGQISFSHSLQAMEQAAFPVTFDSGSYDLKRFMQDHPGGVNTLKTYKGKSIKQAMVKIGHSPSAYHMLRDLSVDDLNLTGKVSGNGRIITIGEKKFDDEEIAFLEEMESRLDWSKPILDQLGAIAPHYEKWVNTAVYRDCRLFASSVLEVLTYTAWYLVPMFWIPIIAYLAVTEYFNHVECGDSCNEPLLSTWGYMTHLATGMLMWSALEYSLHRWLFHMNPGSSVPMIKAHFVLHGMHHKVPFDSYRQVFPPIPAFVMSCILYSIIGPWITRPMIKLTGALAGYLSYDMIHYYVHNGNPKDGTYLYTMKRYHSNHHFINYDKAFGISSKLWDYVFLTFVNVKKLNFSLNWNF